MNRYGERVSPCSTDLRMSYGLLSTDVERDDLGMTSANVIRSVRREVDITAAANKAAVAAGGLQSLKATL